MYFWPDTGCHIRRYSNATHTVLWHYLAEKVEKFLSKWQNFETISAIYVHGFNNHLLIILRYLNRIANLKMA